MCSLIQERIERYSHNEIRFNLMAVIGDRRAQYAKQLADLERYKAQLQAACGAPGGSCAEPMGVDQPADADERTMRLQDLEDEMHRSWSVFWAARALRRHRPSLMLVPYCACFCACVRQGYGAGAPRGGKVQDVARREHQAEAQLHPISFQLFEDPCREEAAAAVDRQGQSCK